MLPIQPLIRYADFSGRARRAEYWLFMTLQTVVYVVCIGMGLSALFSYDIGGMLLATGIGVVVLLACAIPNYAVLARRLHDTGRTAKWMALLLPNILSNFMMIQSVGRAVQRAPIAGMDPKAFEAAMLADLTGAGAIGMLAGLCSLALFVMTLMPSQRGPNRYGPDPKNPDAKAPEARGAFDDARLDALFAEAKKERRQGEAAYKPVFDFGPGPAAQPSMNEPGPARAAVDWGRPAYDPGITPARTFGRRATDLQP